MTTRIPQQRIGQPSRQVGPLPGEEPWVPEPTAGDLAWPKRTIYGGEAKWSRYDGAHQPCALCVEALHDGTTKAHPAPATQKRVGPMGPKQPMLVCARHGTAWKIKDDQIAAKLKAQRVAPIKARPRST